MRSADGLSFALIALRRHPLRSGLTLLAMAVGVAAVVLLTALGEGARRYVTGEFSALGSHLLIVFPGRNETTGGPPPLLGETPRDLTLDDARALLRSRHIARLAPLMVGIAPASHGSLEREATVLGTTRAFLEITSTRVGRGRSLPDQGMDQAEPLVLLGAEMARQLFPGESPLGRWVRLGDRRFRVIGVLSATGQSLGVDLDEAVMVPVAAAQALFNSASLVRIMVEAARADAVETARATILEVIRERHEGEDDITVVTQDAVLQAFDRIFEALTLTVAGIAAVSLLVAAVLIMNVTLVAVSQRRPEIGLLKALGAGAETIRLLFLFEAGLLALVGAGCGVGLGGLGVWVLRQVYPDVPFAAPLWAVLGSLGVALLAGVAFALLPARRAARMDPVAALARR